MIEFRDLIRKKRDGLALSDQEVKSFVSMLDEPFVTKGQIAAMLMAIYLQGMSKAEISALTLAMAQSGESLDLKSLSAPTADKHSTGGVGDKTSLVLVPLMAAAGIKMAKLSGKALGHTGGTLDKLSCFEGFRMDLSTREMLTILHEVGCFISGQTADMVPADKLMYALRNETSTVDSIPLIASSIMSKKIASGAGHILLDVKVGQGAIFSDITKSRELAHCMVEIGRALNRPTRAILTNMNQPLGRAIGNQLEVTEAIETLRGGGSPQLKDLCLVLGQHLLELTGSCSDLEGCKAKLEALLKSGRALQKFKEMIKAQGGDTTQIDAPISTLAAESESVLYAKSSGYIHAMKTKELGLAAMTAMHPHHNEDLDLSAGILLQKKVGDRVEKGEAILTVYGRPPSRIHEIAQGLESMIDIAEDVHMTEPLIIEIIG